MGLRYCGSAGAINLLSIALFRRPMHLMVCTESVSDEVPVATPAAEVGPSCMVPRSASLDAVVRKVIAMEKEDSPETCDDLAWIGRGRNARLQVHRTALASSNAARPASHVLIVSRPVRGS